MIKQPPILAILGPTASGKSDLAIRLALRFGASILSLDSLAVYKEIDIASAKPSKQELSLVLHEGIDRLCVNETFSAALFIKLFERCKNDAVKVGKPLIIVGGSSFYLKAIVDGLSDITENEQSRQKAAQCVADLPQAYESLRRIDPIYAGKIQSTDLYRIQKGFEIYFATGLAPSEHFDMNKKNSCKDDIKIFEIEAQRDGLRQKIELRTAKMIRDGLIDEAVDLEKKYGRAPSSLKSIGLKEVYDYLDGKFGFSKLHETVSTHTAQLAKRQQTFNKTQFENKISLPLEKLEKKIEELLKNEMSV